MGYEPNKPNNNNGPSTQSPRESISPAQPKSSATAYSLVTSSALLKSSATAYSSVASSAQPKSAATAYSSVNAELSSSTLRSAKADQQVQQFGLSIRPNKELVGPTNQGVGRPMLHAGSPRSPSHPRSSQRH